MPNVSPEIQKIVDRINKGGPQARGFVVQENEMVEVNVNDLRQICTANPNHPSSVVFLKATTLHTSGHRITVEKVQIDAILQDKDVGVEIDGEGENEVQRKILVERTTTTTPEMNTDD